MQERRCYRRADATLYEESVQRTTDCSPGELLLLHYVQHTIIMLFCSQVLSMLDVYAFQGVSCWDIYWSLLGFRIGHLLACETLLTPQYLLHKVEVDVRAKIPRHTANQPRDMGGFGGCIAGCNVACYRYRSDSIITTYATCAPRFYLRYM